MGKKFEFENFKLINDLVHYGKENYDTLKKITLPAVVSIAVIFFWLAGGEPAGESEVYEITEQSSGFELDDSTGTSMEITEQNSMSQMIYVDIGGEVVNPGVYEITAGTRLFQVIEKAGGLKETAATDSINQAEAVSDGQKIIIGSLDETSPYYIGTRTGSASAYDTGSQSVNLTGSGAVRMTQDGIMININQATLEELQMIPGVGPSTAQKILDYRKEHGAFAKPEELKKISGIGEKTYENLKDYIEI